MSSAEPATSVFVSTSRDHPLHLWDAFTGNLRATYRAYDHLDEVVAANSVCFNTAGDKIFAGKKENSHIDFNILNRINELPQHVFTLPYPTLSWLRQDGAKREN